MSDPVIDGQIQAYHPQSQQGAIVGVDWYSRRPRWATFYRQRCGSDVQRQLDADQWQGLPVYATYRPNLTRPWQTATRVWLQPQRVEGVRPAALATATDAIHPTIAWGGASGFADLERALPAPSGGLPQASRLRRWPTFEWGELRGPGDRRPEGVKAQPSPRGSVLSLLFDDCRLELLADGADHQAQTLWLQTSATVAGEAEAQIVAFQLDLRGFVFTPAGTRAAVHVDAGSASLEAAAGCDEEYSDLFDRTLLVPVSPAASAMLSLRLTLSAWRPPAAAGDAPAGVLLGLDSVEVRPELEPVEVEAEPPGLVEDGDPACM